MIAESRTEEKDVMVKVVVNLVNKNNQTISYVYKLFMGIICIYRLACHRDVGSDEFL